jgi:hypothetical protein
METKKYIKPEITVFKIHIGQHILAGSDVTFTVTNTETADPTKSLSRDNNSMWDDDDNE